MMNPKTIITLSQETYKEWSEDNASSLAAALAYYTLFSLAPLLIIAIGIAGLVLGSSSRVKSELFFQIQSFVGPDAAKTIQNLINNNSLLQTSAITTIIGLATLVLGASGLFIHIQQSLNIIWEVKPKPGSGLFFFIKSRLLSFAMIVGTGFLLFILVILSTLLSAIAQYFNFLLPAAIPWQSIEFIVSILLITLLFAVVFKTLPDVKVQWKDVWIGSFVTAVLFTIGKFLIGLYLSRSSISSAFGAAGSLVIILLWIYYSAQIFFFGAEFIQVFARYHGERIEPAEGAMRLYKQTPVQPNPPNESAENGVDLEEDSENTE
jgi:membrane protein